VAALCLPKIAPKSALSLRSSPKALRSTLKHIFTAVPDGLWLVGGTALAGFYAEHRRSDDLDLFAIDPNIFRHATLAVKGLREKGAVLTHESSSPYYYHTNIQFFNHTFTVDIVMDKNLHRVGKAIRTKSGTWVADLDTLFAMKVACLVSRCSEKDLFDLNWLFEQAGRINPADYVTVATDFDSGVTIETLLLSLKGATLRQEACDFLPPKSQLTPAKAYQKILDLRRKLIDNLLNYERTQKQSPDIVALKQTIKDYKKLNRTKRQGT
jgi:hypothetical protein